MIIRFLVAAATLLICATSQAEVYKCKNAQGKVEYADAPCPGISSQKINTAVQDFGNAGTQSVGDPNARALTIYIREALAKKDFARATSMATTEEHFAMIREAKAANDQVKAERRERVQKAQTLQELRRANQINAANGRKIDALKADMGADSDVKMKCRRSIAGDQLECEK
jgi:hypothetical protein